MSYRITRTPQQNLNDRNAVRLDALTIAGLTGTPHHHHHRGGFFSEAGPPPGSPGRDSDATLSSIQDSSCGSGGDEREGSVVSILSDELGSVLFSDHDEDDEEDSSSGEDGDAGEGAGGLSKDSIIRKSEKEEDGLEGAGGAAVAAAAVRTREGQEGAGGGTDRRVGADDPPHADAAHAAVARFHPTASSATTNSGDGGALSSIPSGSGGGGDGGDRNFPRAADPTRGGGGEPEEHEERRPTATTTLPLEHRYHHHREEEEDGHPRRDCRTAPPTVPEQRQRPHQRDSNGRDTENVGTSGYNISNSHRSERRSSSSVGQVPGVRRGSAATTAIEADLAAAVSGADSGGGGVASSSSSSSSSLQAATPPGPVPTVTCKILVVGNAKCGKSSIISRFVSNRFSSDYNSTVGADYAMKDVSLPSGRQVRLQLWDIAGQDRFAKLTRAYFRRAKGAIVVCDVTREGTFDAIVRWKEEIDLWCQNEGCDLPVFLLANKSDLLTEVQDSFLAGARMEKTCRESGFAGWYITSAKRGDNIDTAMTNLLQRALEAEERRNRGTEGGRPPGVGEGSGKAGAGGAFQLSSQGRRRDGDGAQSVCC